MEGERGQGQREHRIDRRQFLKGAAIFVTGGALTGWGYHDTATSLGMEDEIREKARREVEEQQGISEPFPVSVNEARHLLNAGKQPYVFIDSDRKKWAEETLKTKDNFDNAYEKRREELKATEGFSTERVVGSIFAMPVGVFVGIVGFAEMTLAHYTGGATSPASSESQQDALHIPSEESNKPVAGYNPNLSRFAHLVIEDNQQSAAPQDKPENRIPHNNRAKLIRLD